MQTFILLQGRKWKHNGFVLNQMKNYVYTSFLDHWVLVLQNAEKKIKV